MDRELAAAEAAGLDYADYMVKQQLERAGKAWTRANFIEQKWRGELPIDEATGQAYVPEDELPAEFQIDR